MSNVKTNKNFKQEYSILIQKAQKKNRGLKKLKNHGKYYNIHHIVPRSLGGSDNDSNLVKLTHAEHYEAHKLLFKIYEGTGGGSEAKMALAWRYMLTREKHTDAEYTEAMEKSSKLQSIMRKNRTSEQKAEFAKKIKETRAKRTPEQRIKSLEKCRKTFSKRTSEQKIEIEKKIIKARKKTLEKKTLVEKAETSKRMRIAHKNRSKEKEDERIKKSVENYKKAIKNRTPERQAEISKALKQVHKNRSKEKEIDRVCKIKETFSKRTLEQKKASYLKGLATRARNKNERK